MYKAEERLVSFGADNQLAEGYKAVVNPETNKLYSIHTKQYTILEHDQVIEQITNEIGKNPEYGAFQQKGPLYYKDGARMETTFTFPEVSIPIGKGDLVNPQVQVLNGYDGNWGLHILFGAYRVVCKNGLTIGEKVLQIHKRHTRQIGDFFSKNILAEEMHQFSIQTKIWESWVNKKIDQEEMDKKIESLHLAKKREGELRAEIEISTGEIVEGQEAMTQWIFFNILCQYITHRLTNYQRIDLSRRIGGMFS